jgi:starch synthase
MASMPLRVAMLAAECEPWAKVGGLGDMVDALARGVGRVGAGRDEVRVGGAGAREVGEPVVAPVQVFLPRYRVVPEPAPGDVLSIRDVRVPDARAPAGSSIVSVIDVEADGYLLRLVDHPAAFDRAGIYGDAAAEYADNAWRYGLFCRAALETLRTDERTVDVLHLHDWHAAPAVVYRDARYADEPLVTRAAVLQTVHNLAYRGWTPRRRLGQLGLAPGDGVVGVDDEGIDLLASGIARAELVNTVSSGFAAEVLTPEHGFGLDALLRSKGDRFIGILNGLDTAVWDPATDRAIAATYSRADRSGKRACRADLLARAGFDAADERAVIGIVGRFDHQKGLDLLASAIPLLVGRGARFIVLGSGDPALAAAFRAIETAHPRAVALIEGFDRDMARRIYAGADLFAMPSRFEPSGQAQMIALRYGTPPIVHRTGGLADTVIDETTHPGGGTGFSFEHATVEGLVWACEAAIAFRGDGTGARWKALLDRAMAVAFDWTREAAPRYVEAYRRAVALRRRVCRSRHGPRGDTCGRGAAWPGP